VYIYPVHMIHFKTQGGKLIAFECPKICRSSHETNHYRCALERIELQCNVQYCSTSQYLSFNLYSNVTKAWCGRTPMNWLGQSIKWIPVTLQSVYCVGF